MTSTQTLDGRQAAPETDQFQAAIDAAARAGGGRVVVPAGVHPTGSLRLRSNVELHLEAGAVLQFIADPALYPPVEARWEGAPRVIHRPCLYAAGEHNIAITGFGLIDGQGGPWWDAHHAETLTHPRPTLIGLHDCERITIRDVTLHNSPAWTVHPLLCRNVTIDNIVIVNPADSPNTDGIDPESCRDVHISNCHIDVGDDCIAIKAGTEASPQRVPCENITITNCTMVRGHGGVVIGSEMSGGVRDVVISNCVFDGTDRGIRIKSRRGRGGVVEDIRVTNIVMRGVMCPIVVNPFYFCGPDGKHPRVADRAALPVDAGTPVFRRIHIAHVTARDVHAAAGFLYGLPEAPLDELTVHDVMVSFATDPTPFVPAMAAGVPRMTRTGLLVGFLTDATLAGMRIVGAEGDAVRAESSPGLDASGVAS